MPDHTLPLFPLPRPTLKHLLLRIEPKRVDYKGNGRGKRSIREINRSEHAVYLTRQLGAVEDWIEQSIPADDIPEMTGIPVQLATTPGYPLSTEDIHALTTQRGKKYHAPVHLHSLQLVDQEGMPYTRILLNVPFGGLGLLEAKIRQFATGTGTTGNLPFLANIETIAPAAIEGLWTDPPDELPRNEDPHWWQFWVRKFPAPNRERFISLANALEVEFQGEDLVLPEHHVFVARSTYAKLASSIPLLDTLAELRSAHCCVLALTDLNIIEQDDYVNEAKERITLPADDAPAVCLLDTGVNRGHRLLEQLLVPSDNDTVFGDGDGSDGYTSICAHGHGTPMAGLAAYGDMSHLTGSTKNWDQLHRLESVRLLDPRRRHEPDNYGSVTLQAVRRPEINNPQRRRTYCLAITAPGADDGKPSAWSAAVDTAAYGDGDESKRLIMVSAGNVFPDQAGTNYTYPDENRNTPIEDPAQAWNAITVGALTKHTSITIRPGDDESRRLTPIVREAGMLSPFSRTSCSWNPHWPLKPEIVLEGGNAAIHPQNGVEYPESLQLVSTSAMARAGRQFCSINATSAATAQAARMAAEVTAHYPDLWPETVRGLLVHAARWTPAMLDGIDPHRRYNKRSNDRQRFIQVLRSYGYGEPDVERAYFSAGHAATLIRQDELNPYKREKSAIKLNDCHIHRLPWPTQLLQDNFEATLTLRVTLSYFVAPNPSANNALKGSRYRYGGSLLRFLVRNKDDTDEARFEARMTRVAQEKEEFEDAAEESLPTDPGWALGTKLCGKGGSLIHDVWRGSAADLSQMDRIAVFPAKGWWAYRKFPEGDPWHECHQLPIRYSLLVSIEADQDIPLYSEISNLITIPVST